MALGTISSSSSNIHNHHHPYQRPSISAYRQQHQYKPRAIAPAPSLALPVAAHKSSSEKFYGGAIGTTLDSNNPAVVRRNARERNRVKQVNNGFTYLRQHIPPAIIADLSNGRRGIGPGAHKKLSKVDTLRMAVEYIRRLQHVIDEVDGKRESVITSPQSASTWSNMTTDSPPPTPPKGGEKIYPHAHGQSALFANKMQHHLQAMNYAESLQQKHQEHQLMHFKYEQLPHLQQQQQQQQQQLLQHQQYFNQLHPALISPAGSVSSSHSSPASSASDCNDSDVLSLYSRQSPNALGSQQFELPLQMKYEQQFNEEVAACSSGDEEDLLEYISLWQDDV